MSTYDLFHRAQQAPGLSQTQKGVLIALLTFADSDGWAWPSLATLASYASVKERAAQAAMADLVAAGLVVRQERVGATCRFRVLVDKLPERGGAPKTPPQEKHPRTKDTPALPAPPHDVHRGGAFPAPGGVHQEHPRGAFPAPEGSNEDTNLKDPVKEPKQRDEAPASPPPPVTKKPVDLGGALTPEEMAAWAAYRLHHPTAKATPPKASAGLLRSAIREHGADAVIAVIRWAHQSDHKQAAFLRDNGYLGLDNLLRKEKLPNRIELAQREEAGEVPKPKLSALPPGVQARRPVVIDAESGRVEEQEPRRGGKPDLFDMADWLKTIDVSAEGREGEEHAEGN